MIAQVLVMLIMSIGIAGGGYYYGHKHATDACDAATLKSVQAAVAEAGRVNEETNLANAAAERARAANIQTFQALRAEVRHATITPDPACRLSVDGLRLWNSANRGDTAGVARGVTRAVPGGPAGSEKR